jgi:desulfoferrodoxin (superoxide reductase-like protein)
MHKLSEMAERQREYIQKMRNHTNSYINYIDKNEIEAILLSGSVSRGDYCPDINGGMIDLIVMKKDGSKITVEEVFGKNEHPFIPYHCIKWNGEWFEILFADFVSCSKFKEFNEPRKFSVMESKILYDPNGKYTKEFETINKYCEEELKNKLKETIGYIKYIVGKESRWEIRKAYPNMHNNLNIAIELGICCLYYLNSKYAPADDRRLYYTYELEKKPKNYDKLIERLFEQKLNSKEDYERRKKYSWKTLLG